MAKTPKRPTAGLPDKDTLLAFLREAGEAEKSDIARAFGLKGLERRLLREMLRELEAEGKLGKRGRKGFAEAGTLPPVGVVDVVARTDDGEMVVQLVKGEADAPQAILVADKERRGAAVGMGAGPPMATKPAWSRNWILTAPRFWVWSARATARFASSRWTRRTRSSLLSLSP